MRYTYDQPDYLDKNGLIHLVDELRGLIEQIVNGNLDVSVYATKEELSAYAKTTDIPSLDGYATKAYVDENIADVATNGEIDLTNYVTKDTVYTKEETDALIPSTEGLATTFYVDNAVSNVDVDLTGYATEEYVSTAISNIPATDLSNYYTKSEVDALIADTGTDEGGTDSGEDNGETPTPTVTGTSAISGNATLKCGYNRTYTGTFTDVSGNTVSDVIGTWTLEGSASSGIEQTVTDNKVVLFFEDEDLIGETVTLTFSDPNGNFTSSSIEIELADIF